MCYYALCCGLVYYVVMRCSGGEEKTSTHTHTHTRWDLCGNLKLTWKPWAYSRLWCDLPLKEWLQEPSFTEHEFIWMHSTSYLIWKVFHETIRHSRVSMNLSFRWRNDLTMFFKFPSQISLKLIFDFKLGENWYERIPFTHGALLK